jgi:hypothetical protein
MMKWCQHIFNTVSGRWNFIDIFCLNISRIQKKEKNSGLLWDNFFPLSWLRKKLRSSQWLKLRWKNPFYSIENSITVEIKIRANEKGAIAIDVCMYVCMYVCIFECMCACIYGPIYVCTYKMRTLRKNYLYFCCSHFLSGFTYYLLSPTTKTIKILVISYLNHKLHWI